MSDADYYPAGAYNDPDAPWNQVDYSEQARDVINDEIKTFDPCFCEFIDEHIDAETLESTNMPEDIYSKEWEKWYQARDCGWRDKMESMYVDYRMEDVVDDLAEADNEDPDYDEDYYRERDAD